VRMENVAPESRHARYLLEPRKLADLERVVVRRGLVVLGYFHSHPTSSPVPSRTDLVEAWPGYSYLIQPAEGSPRAWRLAANEKDFVEERILCRDQESVDCAVV